MLSKFWRHGTSIAPLLIGAVVLTSTPAGRAELSGRLAQNTPDVIVTTPSAEPAKKPDEPTPPASAPAATPAPPNTTTTTTPDKPKIAEPINDMVRVIDTVETRDRPDPGGKPLGRLRAGVKIKAIGVVEGGKWVQIELPNQGDAFIARDSIAIGGAAAAPGSSAASNPDKITGPVSAVPNAAALTINGKTLRLSGIDPGPASALAGYETWVRSRGDIECEPVAQTGRYHCFTNTGVDVAEAAILNGAGRVGDGASPTYRDRENVAREAKKGLWAHP